MVFFRCRFKRGKLPVGWHDKEYNVKDKRTIHGFVEVLIGKTWIKKSDIEIVNQDEQPIILKPKNKMKDVSEYKAFPNNYEIPKGTKVVVVKEHLNKDDYGYRPIGLKGVTTDAHTIPYCDWEDGKKDICMDGTELAPLNPKDHPEHPDFGKQEPTSTQSEITKIDNKLQQLAKVILENESWTAHDLFIYIVAEDIL